MLKEYTSILADFYHIVRSNKRCYIMADSVSIYDEIEIEDMTFDPVLQIYHYPCPCGDRFEIGLADLRDGEDIGVCPSCSLMIRVIFDEADLPKDDSGNNGGVATAITA
ncbi:diphthamide biosynthesis protein [Trichophyton mentagrophytes]|nr:diphthamide biosynthesis protein [Trichophyton mentagrophytes]